MSLPQLQHHLSPFEVRDSLGSSLLVVQADFSSGIASRGSFLTGVSGFCHAFNWRPR
jgi:hypothetical protein